jgi:hypothetical protein
MSDFLDRLGAELIAAEHRLVAETAGVPMPAPQPLRRPRRLRGRRRGTLFAFAALLISGGALASRPWQPLLGDPSRDNTPNGTSITRPPAAQLRELGVLHRPQSPADQAAARDLLAMVGGEFKGVRVNSIRLLRAPNGHVALLVPTEAHGVRHGGGYETHNRLCLITPAGYSCSGAKEIAMQGMVDSSYSIRYPEPNIHGLVPDGVATVQVMIGDKVRTAPVHDNFWWIAGMSLGLPNPTITWFDAHGRRVEPLKP